MITGDFFLLDIDASGSETYKDDIKIPCGSKLRTEPAIVVDESRLRDRRYQALECGGCRAVKIEY